MFDRTDGLLGGLNRAERDLREAQRDVARANAGMAERGGDAAMAHAARAAIFESALLGALHARLQEIKAAAR